ncbi:hypothetical protein HUK65_09705 [Rhodobacteraceae bacterium 2376]|uniref:Uncharacterized protein n=1 Tax=Rhabdonatronobacter sediminivivens TaxID=2743469 RepID=A0A7Z0KZ79_9RHOB|nr:hypothetical protein [Rhabdonatronobacter sediminivivens]NYS25266.1 hypothetical protein [Rhabdonatronobacter sediminivivens]
MINENDILDFCDLTRAEIHAIALHEHLSEVEAAELGDYLIHIHHGAQKVQGMICDDIRDALHKGNLAEARALYKTLHEFLATHPEALRGNA